MSLRSYDLQKILKCKYTIIISVGGFNVCYLYISDAVSCPVATFSSLKGFYLSFHSREMRLLCYTQVLAVLVRTGACSQAGWTQSGTCHYLLSSSVIAGTAPLD
jgi:hypothetical protein